MEHEIRQARLELAGALGRGDAGRAAALYADDGKLLSPAAELIDGQAEIEAYWRAGIVLGLSRVDLHATAVELSGPVAVELGRYTLGFGLDGSTRGEAGKYLVLYRRQADGAWRRAVDVFNPDVPPKGRSNDEEAR